MTGPRRYPLPQPSRPSPHPPARPSGATAVVSGLLGLPASVAAGYVPVRIFLDMPAEFSLAALPGKVLLDLATYLVAALVLLIGALAMLFRATAGAIMLIIGGLTALGALLGESMSAGIPFGRYLGAMFGRGGFAMADRITLVVLAVLVTVLAMLPPTFRHLRYRSPILPAYARAGIYPPQRW